MIQQFRNLNFINIILLFILLFFLRIGIYLDLPADINTGFFELFKRLLIPTSIASILSPSLNITIAALVVFSQALIFNKIINNYNILGKSSFLPALSFIVASSVFTPFLFLSPPLVCNFFLLYILHRILLEYKNADSISGMFDLGLIIALGTLVYFPFVLFLLFLWFALIILKPFNWREWTSVVIGYVTVVFLLGVYYYWNGKLTGFYEIWEPLSKAFPFYIKIQITDYIVLLPIVICMLLGVGYIRQNFFKSFVQVRKTFQLLFFLFVIASLSFYLKTDFRRNHFLLCVIPVSAVLAYYFASAKIKWIYESLFVLMISFVVYFQFV
jgi:hypothetical protein